MLIGGLPDPPNGVTTSWGIMTIRIDEIEDLLQIDQDNILHSWTAQGSYIPSIVTRAQGNYFWDAEGKRYLDFTSQAWFANIGHGDKRVRHAIDEYDDLPLAIYGRSTLPKLLLAKKILSLLPGGYARVFFGCNGSDAVEAALKIARHVTKRQEIIAFWNGYHGASMGATSVTGIPKWRTTIGSTVPGTTFVPAPYHYRSNLAGSNQDETDRNTLAYLEYVINSIGSDTVAAIIGEPIIATGGCIVPGRGFWRGVRSLCDRYDILLISDEIVTGFGRTGFWFARDYYDYKPDIIAFAKGLSSGYAPLSAAVLNNRVSGALNDTILPHGLTYSGHPLACAVALANINVIEMDGLIDRAGRRGRRLIRDPPIRLGPGAGLVARRMPSDLG
jgi:taurine---2-oxoglutarate transaminase